jgi:hypothetical protein
MASKVTMALTISGLGTFGSIGPRSLVREVVSQNVAPEMPVFVAAGDVDKVIAIPPMSSQRCVVIATTNPVKYRVNAELTVDDKQLEINGFSVLPSTPVVTQLLLTGNGATGSDVYILPIGN